MKKILFAIVAIAMVLVSCKKGNEAKNLSISMELASQPSVAGVSIKCTPSDSSIFYSLVCIPTDSLSKFDINAASQEVYDACAKYGFEKVALNGVYTVVYDGELDPNTKYTPVAFQIDKKNRIYKTLFYGPEFQTKVLPTTKMKIDITYAGDGVVTFTPDNNNESYVAVIVDSTLLYYWDLAEVGYVDALANAVLDAYAYDPKHTSTFTGAISMNISTDVRIGDCIYAVAAPVYESHVNGAKTAKIFTVGTASNVAPRSIQPRSLRRSSMKIARR